LGKLRQGVIQQSLDTSNINKQLLFNINNMVKHYRHIIIITIHGTILKLEYIEVTME